MRRTTTALAHLEYKHTERTSSNTTKSLEHLNVAPACVHIQDQSTPEHLTRTLDQNTSPAHLIKPPNPHTCSKHFTRSPDKNTSTRTAEHIPNILVRSIHLHSCKRLCPRPTYHITCPFCFLLSYLLRFDRCRILLAESE